MIRLYMKRFILLSIVILSLFTSCLSQKAVLSNEKYITPEIKSVTPQWKKHKGAPYKVTMFGAMVGAAFVGWNVGDEVLANNQENNPNDNEIIAAAGFGVLSLWIYDGIFNSRKRKEQIKEPIPVQTEDQKKWLRKYNAKENTKYVVFNRPNDQELQLISKSNLSVYSNYRNRIVSLSDKLNASNEVMLDEENAIIELISDHKGKVYPTEVDNLTNALERQRGLAVEEERTETAKYLEKQLSSILSKHELYTKLRSLGDFRGTYVSEINSLDVERRSQIERKVQSAFEMGTATLVGQELDHLKSLGLSLKNWKKMESWASHYDNNLKEYDFFREHGLVKQLWKDYLSIRKSMVTSNRHSILIEMNSQSSFSGIERVKRKYGNLISDDKAVEELLEKVASLSKEVILERRTDKSNVNVFANLSRSQALSSKEILGKIREVKLDFRLRSVYADKTEVINMLERVGIKVSEDADVILELIDNKEAGTFYSKKSNGDENFSTNVTGSNIRVQLYTYGLKYYNGEIVNGLTIINSISNSYLIKTNEITRLRNGYKITLSDLLSDVFSKPFIKQSATPKEEWSKVVEKIFDESSSIDMKSQSSNGSLSWLKSINRVNQNDYKSYLGGWNVRLKKLGVLFAEKDNYGVDQASILHSISSKGYDMTDDSGKDVFVVLGDANVILKNCLILLNGDWYRYPGSVYTHRRSRMCVSDEVSTSRVSLVKEAVEDFSVKYLKGK